MSILSRKFIPPELTAENLERAVTGNDAGAVFDFDATALVDRRVELYEETSELLTRTAGRARLADEQRRYDANQKLIGLIDRVLVRQREWQDRDTARRERRYNEAAEIRMRHPEIFNTSTTSTTTGSEVFGLAIRDAIGEVLEGRAESFVDYPNETRTLTDAGTAGQGVPIQFMQPVSTLMAKSVVMSLPGLRTVSMTSDRARWPRIGSATVSGVAEAATLTAADTQTDSVDVVAQKYATLEYLSTELWEDYSTDALAVFGGNLLARLGLAVDLGLLEGTGASSTVGIRNVVGANSTSVAATPTNFAKFRTAEYELRLDNGDPVVWVMHPRTWNTLAGIKTGITSDETTLLEPNPQEGPRTLLGYPVAMSTQITLTEGTNGSWTALLDTSQLLVAERRPARLEISRDFAFDTDRIAVRATWRGALAALNPEAISLCTDVRA